jgi:hypothetical protein
LSIDFDIIVDLLDTADNASCSMTRFSHLPTL